MQDAVRINSATRPPLWRDERVLNVLSQVLVVAVIAGFLYYVANNALTALEEQKGVAISYEFLGQVSGFDIGESLIEYSRDSTYARAFLVGLLNTLQVAVLGVFFATILGFVVGIARLSTNFLVNRLALVYVETLRNIPLLLILFFWYQAVFLKLPRIRDAIELPGPIFISNKNFTIPWPVPAEGWDVYRFVLVAAVIVTIAVGYALRQYGRRTGRMPLVTLWSVLAFLAISVLGFFVIGQPLDLSRPVLEGFNTDGGRKFTIEFTALLSALAIYTSAFIAETVRAGIQSVSKGQREAATALGLSGFQTLRLVIIPQAMRVIIPPLTSQYLNLTKNSSLAVAVGYPDLFQVVAGTTLNQTGRAIEAISLTMAVYLTFSLTTSFLMNLYNRSTRLVER